MTREARPFERIAEELRVRITSGELADGDPVPTIRALAEQHGVAQATVQRALNALKTEGLIRARVGSGTVVVGQDVREVTVAVEVEDTASAEVVGTHTITNPSAQMTRELGLQPGSSVILIRLRMRG